MSYQLLPALSAEEYAELKASIAEKGVQVPIEYDEAGNVLDGHHRLQACQELGIKDWPRIVRAGLTEKQKLAHVLALNLARRNLSKDQRDGVLIAARERGMSIRKIAETTGIPQTTVFRAVSGVPNGTPATITGRDGKQYAAQRASGLPALALPGTTYLCRDCSEFFDVQVWHCPICHHHWPMSRTDCWNCHEYSRPDEPPETPQVSQRTPVYQPVAVTMFSAKSEEYYTPSEYIEAARAVLGGIDLDPASCEMAQRTVQAARYFTKEQDGLMQPWDGRVFLNPPYGTTAGQSNQGLWANKLIAEYTVFNVTAAILLVKAALGYEWFESLWYEWPVCFPRQRLSFMLPSGDDDGQSKQASALFYMGGDVARFAEVFRRFGRVIMPEGQ